MTIEQALAWADQTMNERLREAREAGNDHDYDAAMEGCIDILAAEVRRCHARRCETCKHQRCYGDYEECDRTQGDDYGNRTECKTMGGGCLAWEKRDE